MLADNLAHYRKTAGFTQLELADKLNYSDKAISKWERGESAPDIFVLKQISDIYGITVNDLLAQDKMTVKKRTSQFRAVVTMLSVGIVWLIAVIAFVLIKLIGGDESPFANLSFVYAIPISAIIVLVFATVWENKITGCISASIIIWGILLSLALSIVVESIWLLLIVGIPLQIMIVLWYLLRIDINLMVKFGLSHIGNEVNIPPENNLYYPYSLRAP